MPLLSCHEPGTTEKYGASSFLLPDLRCRFSTAERREAAVPSGADRFLFFLTEDTTEILFGMNFIRLLQFRTRKLTRSEEYTSELQSPYDLVCRLLLEKKK